MGLIRFSVGNPLIINLMLVLLSLYLFLNFRVAPITAMGVPVSFLVAVSLIYYLGFTINMISLFAFLIALGLIVDDAIIVTENIYRHMEQGVPAAQVAQSGAREVMRPVLAATSTTVAAFLPMFAIGGTLGECIKVIPVVVAASLVGSLWEAFAVLPSHATELLRVDRQRRPAGRIDWAALLHRYVDFLRWAVRNRYFVSLVALGVLALAVSYAATRLPFQLFGKPDIGQFFINIEASNTYSLGDTELSAKRIEKSVLETLSQDELDTMLTNVGVTLIDFDRSRFGSNYIQLIVDLQKQVPEGFIERFITPLVSLKFNWEGSGQRETETIVNEARKRLILVDFAKRLREQGWDRIDAMVEAGRVRVRPILLTTVTTFLGISPLIFFASGQTAFLSPMAVSLGFGLLFATALILVAVPCFYLIADDLRQRVSGWLRRPAGHPVRRA